MFSIPSMSQIIAWFGWGNGIGAVAAISIILTLVVIVAPVIAGLLLYGLEHNEERRNDEHLEYHADKHAAY